MSAVSTNDQVPLGWDRETRTETSGNAVQEKSYAFAVRIVRMYQHLSKEKREFVLSKQVLRSGTSIGANVEEAIGGLSKKDFAARMGIA